MSCRGRHVKTIANKVPYRGERVSIVVCRMLRWGCQINTTLIESHIMVVEQTPGV
jgi:hypothetical protein